MAKRKGKPAATGKASSPPPAARSGWRVRAWAAVLVVLAVVSFLIDWGIVTDGGSIDYRNRVTGARMLAGGLDPYHTKWEMGMSERFCDVYDNPRMPNTKTTVTPAMLVLGLPVALAPYPLSQRLWLMAQWLCLAVLWWVWWKALGRTSAAAWWWSAMVVAFSYSLAWRLHVDRGQAYIVWAMMLGVWLRMAVVGGDGWRMFARGMLGGLLVCLRPPLLIVIGPWVVWRDRGQVLGMVAGVALGVALPMVPRPTVWQDYSRSMSVWSESYRENFQPRPGPQSFPPEMEGMAIDDYGKFVVAYYLDSSMFRLMRAYGHDRMAAEPVLGALAVLFGLWFWFIGRRAGMLLLALACWVFLADFFLPAYRNQYNDVLFLPVFALFCAAGGVGRRVGPVHVLAFLAVALSAWLLWIAPPYKNWLHLPTLCWLAATIGALGVAGSRAHDPRALKK